jgi:hypothetical protein
MQEPRAGQADRMIVDRAIGPAVADDCSEVWSDAGFPILLFATWPMTYEHVWATAAILGAITGSFVAYLSTRVAPWHRST